MVGTRADGCRFVEDIDARKKIVVVPEKKKKKKANIATNDGKGAATKTQAEILAEQRKKAKKLHGVAEKKKAKETERNEKKAKKSPKRRAKPA